jgi:hypothetical protein
MTERTSNQAEPAAVGEDAPPVRTAIVRPLRHVRAVRQRHLEQLAGRSADGESRSARAWSWALGETATAPVSGRTTAVPPGRPDIAAEISEADDRRLRGDHEDRADGAATVLRWLIGDDDHLPVSVPDKGVLVGSFGDVVRSPSQVASAVAGLSSPEHQGERRGNDLANQHDFRDGALATLSWIQNRRAHSPIGGTQAKDLTTRDLKVERLCALDLVEDVARDPASPRPSDYGSGVKAAIDWLLGDAAEVQFSQLLREN